MYLLDTNVLSELRTGKPQPDAQVLAWAAGVPLAAQYVSVVTWMEIDIGILRLERRTPPQGQALRAWLGGVRRLFAERTLAIDDAVGGRGAPRPVPHPAPPPHPRIGATPAVPGVIQLLRHTADFAGIGVELINPWQQPPSEKP